MDFISSNKIPIIITECILFLCLAIIHLILFTYIEETDFENIFDVFESSPLFDFSISKNCGSKSHITFHVWEGRLDYYSYYKDGRYHTESKVVDKTNIDKINGYYFCYKNISYKDLLYNNQILKKGENCQGNYPKDCGIIDTLNQHLCIKNDESCPLYDVGIGQPDNLINYYYDSNNDIYYNKEDYNDPNKKIIGKIFLNDGQPCYRLNERLWRKFDPDEAGQENLQCKLEIFGKFTDDRYKNKGNITYKELYEDNLTTEILDLIIGNIFGEPNVSLYSREFLGIDKKCDEESHISKDDYEKLQKNQFSEKICILIQSLIIIIYFGLTIAIICSCRILRRRRCHLEVNDVYLLVSFILGLLMLFICIICQSIFLGNIIYYDISYECSDDITNELIRKEYKNRDKSIIYTVANLIIDLFVFLLNIIPLLIIFIKSKLSDCAKENKEQNKNLQNNYNSKNAPEQPIAQENLNVQRRLPSLDENKINNQIDNNNQNQENPYPILQKKVSDLEVAPPPISQGGDSNANL